MVESNNVGLKDYKYSEGWLDGFKRMHNTTLQMMHGEAEIFVLNEQTWAQFAVVKDALH